MASVVCPACRLENSSVTMFCRGCGGVLKGAAAQPQFAPQAAQRAPGAQAWGCPTCRKENAPHYKFCLGCGADRDAVGAPVAFGPTGVPVARQGGIVVLIVVVALIVVGAFVAGAAAFLLR